MAGLKGIGGRVLDVEEKGVGEEGVGENGEGKGEDEGESDEVEGLGRELRDDNGFSENLWNG